MRTGRRVGNGSGRARRCGQRRFAWDEPGLRSASRRRSVLLVKRRSWQGLASIAFVGFVASGCGDDGSGGGDGEAGGTVADDTGGGSGGTEGSGGTDGTTSSGPDAVDTSTGTDTGVDVFDPDTFVVADVFGVPNLDDDDSDGSADWMQLLFEADDDVSSLDIPGAPAGYSVELVASGDIPQFRVWDGETFAIGVSTEGTADRYNFEPGPEGTELLVEFADYGTVGGLQVLLLDPDGEELSSQDIRMMGSPLIMNHHLQPSEGVWAMDVDANFGDNAAMIADYESVLGDDFTPVDDATYGFDVWVQDEIEFATSTGVGGLRLDTVIDSVRDRGLDPLAEDEFVGPGFIAPSWGDPAAATSWDSFGNLEASPPVTVDGVDYPFGRIYYGRTGTNGLQTELGDFLAEQRLQEPFQLDTLWLCVGHVDEFSSFVPDPSSEKGFKLLLSDVDAAYEILDDLPSGMQLARYGPDHGYPTAGSLQNDAGLRAYNLDLQADELDPIHDRFVAELGLEESDIIYIPSLFEDISGCGAAALIPGMVNLIVSNPEAGPVDLFIPDPFFRTVENDQSSDPFIDAFTAAMPEGMELHYVDNWDVYHLGLGEVHCGTNVLRTPAGDWWTSAMHLLETSR